MFSTCFVRGLASIIPEELLCLCTCDDLERLICGAFGRFLGTMLCLNWVFHDLRVFCLDVFWELLSFVYGGCFLVLVDCHSVGVVSRLSVRTRQLFRCVVLSRLSKWIFDSEFISI